jgi:hypothetical protein
MASERVTVTLPEQLVDEIDRRERNRSRFILTAVERELARRRQEELRRSLENPHPDGAEIAEVGQREWWSQTSQSDLALLDPQSGTAVRWEPGLGWIEPHDRS